MSRPWCQVCQCPQDGFCWGNHEITAFLGPVDKPFVRRYATSIHLEVMDGSIKPSDSFMSVPDAEAQSKLAYMRGIRVGVRLALINVGKALFWASVFAVTLGGIWKIFH